MVRDKISVLQWRTVLSLCLLSILTTTRKVNLPSGQVKYIQQSRVNNYAFSRRFLYLDIENLNAIFFIIFDPIWRILEKKQHDRQCSQLKWPWKLRKFSVRKPIIILSNICVCELIFPFTAKGANMWYGHAI